MSLPSRTSLCRVEAAGQATRGDGPELLEQGAPNLTDAIWLYGGTKAGVVESIRTGRGGIMPSA